MYFWPPPFYGKVGAAAAVSITQTLAAVSSTGFSQSVAPGAASVTQAVAAVPSTGFSQTFSGAADITQSVAAVSSTGFSQSVSLGVIEINQTLGSVSSTGFSQSFQRVHTVKQSGGQHTTLASAVAAAGDGDTISIEGTWTVDDTAVVAISTGNLTITADSDSKHQGYWNPSSHSHYRLVVGSRGQDACLELVSGAAGTSVDGIAIKSTSTANGTECIKNNSGGTATFKNLIVWNSAGTSDNDGVHAGGVDGSITNIINCAIYSAYRAGINIQAGDGETIVANVLSCTIWDCGQGTDSSDGGIHARALGTGSATYNIFNTVSVGNGGDGDYGQTGDGTLTWNISNSMDSDNSIATVRDTGANNYASYTATTNTSPGAGDWAIFQNLTEATADLRLVSDADNDAQTLHSVDSAHGMSIGGTAEAVHEPTDIKGNTRTSPYDIGSHSATDDAVSAISQSVAAVSSTGFSQTVVPGAASVTQAVAEAADTGFSQSVSVGAATVTQTLGAVASTGFSQTILMGGEIAHSLGAVSSTGFSQSVVPGAVTVTQTVAEAADTGFSQTLGFGGAAISQTLASVSSTGFSQSFVTGPVAVTQAVGVAASTGFQVPFISNGATTARTSVGGIGIAYFGRAARPTVFIGTVASLEEVASIGFQAIVGLGIQLSNSVKVVNATGFSQTITREGDTNHTSGYAPAIGYQASISSPRLWDVKDDGSGVWTEQPDSAANWS